MPSRIHGRVVRPWIFQGSPQLNLGGGLPARLPFSSGGKSFYVDPATGNDTRTYTEAQNPSTPWATINKAVTTVVLSTDAGSTIWLANGTYQSVGGSYVCLISGKDVVGGDSNPITIRATNEGQAVITGSAMGGAFTIGSFIFNSEGWRLQGLKFSVQGLNSVGVQIEDSEWIELYRCTFVDTGEISVKSRGSNTRQGADIGIWCCKFAPSGTVTWERSGAQWVNDPIATDFCAGLDTGNSGGLTGYYGTKGSHCCYLGQSGSEASQGGVIRGVVANNIFSGKTPGRLIELGSQAVEHYVVNNVLYGNEPSFYNNTDDASYNSGYAGEGVALFANSSSFGTRNCRIVNNIFQDTQGHAVYGSVGFNMTDNQVFNNLAFSLTNGYDGSTEWQENRFDDYHQTFGGNTLFSEPGGQISSADPLFVSPARSLTADFHLQGGSPARGVALHSYCPPTNFDGVARTSADLGAY